MRSMTGYGTARGKAGRAHFIIEARSGNHRFSEASVRMPGRLSLLENDIISLVKKRFFRGKVEIFIKEESASREDIEVEIAKKCHHVLNRIQKELRLSGKIGVSELMAFRSASSLSSGLSNENFSKLKSPILKIVDRALSQLAAMRSREGMTLKKWLQERLKRLSRLVKSLEKEANSSQSRRRKQVAIKLKKMTTLTDEKVAEGAALVANRADVTEELVRLKSHLSQFQKGFGVSEAKGRRLDFLTQEMGREINTLGSKVVGSRAVHQVIDFKTELEKIREQVQNVE